MNPDESPIAKLNEDFKHHIKRYIIFRSVQLSFLIVSTFIVYKLMSMKTYMTAPREIGLLIIYVVVPCLILPLILWFACKPTKGGNRAFAFLHISVALDVLCLPGFFIVAFFAWTMPILGIIVDAVGMFLLLKSLRAYVKAKKNYNEISVYLARL